MKNIKTCNQCKKKGMYSCSRCGTNFCSNHGDTERILCSDCFGYCDIIECKSEKIKDE